MAVFVTSTSQATTHGVYAIERTPPTTIRATGSGTVGLVEQFPWGPDGTAYTIADIKDFIDTYAPAGADRTGAGYMSVIGRAWPVLKIVRVLGPTAAAATCTINKAGPTAMLTVTAKYKGSLGNSLTALVEAATDGDANHFNLTVTLTSAFGTTQDKFENLNYSGVGTDSAPDCTNCLLVESIAKVATGTPIVGSSSFAGGDDGVITSVEYVGTQGAGDKGVSLLEGEEDIDIVITGDPGSTLRAAVNAGLIAHADYKTDRVAFINNDSGKTAAQCQTDVASYRSLRACYIDVWAYMRDDVDGTERLTAPATWAATVAANLSPSTSMAWKSSTVKALTRNISRLEALRGQGHRYANTLAGICTLMKEPQGGFTFEAAVVTNAPVNPAKKSLKRTRMGHYIARSFVQSLRENTDAPNVPIIQQDEVAAVEDFLGQLKRNRDTDPVNLPHVDDFGIRDLKAFNTTTSLANGDFTIPVDVKITSDQSRIFLSLNYSETVTVSTEL